MSASLYHQQMENCFYFSFGCGWFWFNFSLGRWWRWNMTTTSKMFSKLQWGGRVGWVNLLRWGWEVGGVALPWGGEWAKLTPGGLKISKIIKIKMASKIIKIIPSFPLYCGKQHKMGLFCHFYRDKWAANLPENTWKICALKLSIIIPTSPFIANFTRFLPFFIPFLWNFIAMLVSYFWGYFKCATNFQIYSDKICANFWWDKIRKFALCFWGGKFAKNLKNTKPLKTLNCHPYFPFIAKLACFLRVFCPFLSNL